jgi:leucyl-tRNA synthetase
MMHSGPWDGLPSTVMAQRMADWLTERGVGRRRVQYRLRDWLISRQRYWGAPIPIVYCDRCGIVPIPEEQLPVRLPPIDAWLPGEGGRSPLANDARFANTACPACDGPARRETDTMDGFACSSWYFLRFTSPQYNEGPFDPAALAAWGHPDLYVGGAEHAVMHLLYARFWTKVMADAGLVPFREPFPRLRSQGVMHAADARTGEVRRMAKSAGNVVTPDSVAQKYGADALRLYLLFMAPFENHTVWSPGGITGPRRFLERTWRLISEVARSPETQPAAADAERSLGTMMAATARRVAGDIEALAFNTAVAALMECLNGLVSHRETAGITPALAKAGRTFVLLLAPFAPFIAEALWERLGGPYSVHQQAWPDLEAAAILPATEVVVVQVDGRVRDRLTLRAGAGEEEARAAALDSPAVQRALNGREPVRAVFVPGRIINIVTREMRS